jgi:uncharacterized phage protein (TIGR02218 family)
MRTINPTLQSHLDSGTTTLCQCWRLTLRTGEKFGFTDHDKTLIFDGTQFEAQAGFTGSEIQSSIGLNIDNLEASGALQSNQLDETRLQAGDYDHAAIEIWRVNWQDPSQRLLQRKGHLGEVSYGQGHFTAEVRGLAHLLNQQKGRLYHFSCDATLGDARCGAIVTGPSFQSVGTITQVNASGLKLSGLTAYDDDWFTRGIAKFSNGRSLSIKRHRKIGPTAQIDFWTAPKFVMTIGAQAILLAGCDKQFSTCAAKFANASNFRGFPHMPGSDFVLGVASKSDQNNGLKRS